MNKPMGFTLSLINGIRVNKSAVERRVQRIVTGRTFKEEAQAAVLLRAVSCMDLTTLSGSDTPGKVERICAKARQPVEQNYVPLTVGAVCVYPAMVERAAKALAGSGIPVASVATGFPAGQTFPEIKIQEIEMAVEKGATEIDVVISREFALTGRWGNLYEEVKKFREACGERAKLKTILGVGDLVDLEMIAKASVTAILAGSDFIKTSTGFEPTNATLEVGLVMVRQIRRFRDFAGVKVGFKPAGGIKTAKDAMNWLALMLEELGEEWTKPKLFRLGASGLLTDIERQLHHLATGRYSAAHHHPMG